jgi:hypothetical protein
MCKKVPVISLLSIPNTFCNQEGNANISLVDNNDPSGVHINNEGVNKLIGQLYSYMSNVEQVDVNCRTPSMRKRNLSSTTPQSSEKLGICKLHKSATQLGVV